MHDSPTRRTWWPKSKHKRKLHVHGPCTPTDPSLLCFELQEVPNAILLHNICAKSALLGELIGSGNIISHNRLC